MMNEFTPSLMETQWKEKKFFLFDNEKKVLERTADIFRKGFNLKSAMIRLEPKEEKAKVEFEEQARFINERVDGYLVADEVLAGELVKNSQNLINKAESMSEIAPNYTGYIYAQLAEWKQIAGLDFDNDLNKAKEFSQKSANINKLNPKAFLPEAIILGIEKRFIENKSLPELSKIAKTVIDDLDLLKDFALVLKEEDRENFLSLIPGKERQKVSAVIDREKSHFLKENIVSEEQKPQRIGIQQRSAEGLEKAFNFDGFLTKPIIKMLAQTLNELEGDDSIRILQKVGVSSLKGDKDLKKQLTKISFSSRIIKELSEIDSAKGGNLTMKFLAKKELPPRIFWYFCQRLIKGSFLTNNLKSFIDNQQYLPFLRKLIAEYPNQFNTVIDTLCDMRFINYPIIENQNEIFNALKDLDALTPIIFNRYRQADDEGKKKLSHQIRELKPSFFRNKPVRDILAKDDRDILTEMIYLAYKPVRMSFEEVSRLISKFKDKTEDLESYIFPEEGYPFELVSQKPFQIKEGKILNLNRIKSFKELFISSDQGIHESRDEVNKLFLNLAKAKTDFNVSELARMFSLISNDELIKSFLGRYQTVSEQNSFNYLMELKEILGVYFKDNYQKSLESYLEYDSNLKGSLLTLLSQPKRQKAIEQLFGSEAEKISWESMTVEEIFSKILSNKVLKSFREEIAREINKFEESTTGEKLVSSQTGLRAFISKNVGSFFAKASAGICTANDVNLFARSDHFHINIVENEQLVRANIQAYFVNINGQKSLLLRGFNPNIDWLEKIDAGAFCEAILDIAKKFQKENSLVSIYISGQEGAYHALSNREKVATYLKKYLKEKNEVSFSFNITNDHHISHVYKI